MSAEERITLSKSGPLATVTLTRPDHHNAITLAMWRDLAHTFERLSEDTELRAVILKGAGGTFSSGAEISEFREAAVSQALARDFWHTVNRANKAIEDCIHPVIAAVERYALGAALDLACACDLRLVDERARLGVPAANIGVMFGMASVARLSGLIGESQANWLLLTGYNVPAHEALRMGLVSMVCSPGEMEGATRQLVRHLGRLAPLAVRDAKRNAVFLRRYRIPYGADDDLPRWGGSADLKEGIAAFLAGRQPQFQGR